MDRRTQSSNRAELAAKSRRSAALTSRRPNARASLGKGARVFVAFSHRNRLHDKVELLLRRWGMEPILLCQQPGGLTVSELLEKHAGAVDFGIVLLTPDDEGRTKRGDGERGRHGAVRPRAGQNIIFEWGFLIGVLGRERVAVIMKKPKSKKLQLPSDTKGILYLTIHKHIDEIQADLRHAMRAESAPRRVISRGGGSGR